MIRVIFQKITNMKIFSVNLFGALLAGGMLLSACGGAGSSSDAAVDAGADTAAGKWQSPDYAALAKDPHRPQVHFSPAAKWMNDPNGMVYSNGVYHLFYQHYPDSTVWGPMHWAHATSTDLVHWQHQPIGIYPDSLGWIFSGSAVVDVNNTSGLGRDGKPPLVAIYTYHNSPKEKTGAIDFQYQGIAYSLDEGRTWEKYTGNPVLKNPGIRDFRDPKVMWYEAGKKWIMTLATQDRITFYSSPDLKGWTKESEFGKDLGNHGGVWECPDLFPLQHEGKTVWVLIVSINPGGPNGGSATQYFTGSFDGKTFVADSRREKWIDYGPDNYAGITWSGTGDRKVFIGWMNNWQYANQVPTEKWRGAATLPRELRLEKVEGEYYVASALVKELEVLGAAQTATAGAGASFDPASGAGKLDGAAKLVLGSDQLQGVTVTLSNSRGERVLIGYDAKARQYYIDRKQSGKVAFEKGFAARHTAPRLAQDGGLELVLVIDKASVELLADGGLTVMTSVFFPNEDFNDIRVETAGGQALKTLQFTPLKSIY